VQEIYRVEFDIWIFEQLGDVIAQMPKCQTRPQALPIFSMVTIDAAIELVPWQMMQKLLENGFAGMHGNPPMTSGKDTRNKFKSKKEQSCQRA